VTAQHSSQPFVEGNNKI